VAIGIHLWRWNPLRHHGDGNPTSHIVEKFTHKLKLTGDQQKKLTVILEKSHARMEDLRRNSLPKFQGIQKDTALQIEKILDSGQLEKFRAMEKKMLARHGDKGMEPGKPCD
jgi:hypothetical protein